MLYSQSRQQAPIKYRPKLSVSHIRPLISSDIIISKLNHTHLDAGTLCFFCRSTRNLSPTWRYTSTSVLNAVSRTVDMGSPKSFTTDGTSRDNDRDCAPCLKQVILTLINDTKRQREKGRNIQTLFCKQSSLITLKCVVYCNTKLVLA
jgi:hypothetical protein